MADDVYTKMAWEFTGVPCDLTCEGSEFCTHDLAKFAREVAARTLDDVVARLEQGQAKLLAVASFADEYVLVLHEMRRRAEEIRRG